MEFPAGTDQVIVTYGTAEFPNLMGAGLTKGLLARVAEDAAARASGGWRIASLDTFITAYTGTIGNVFAQTGSGYPTDVVVSVVYARTPPTST
jgi:hypothetical protein